MAEEQVLRIPAELELMDEVHMIRFKREEKVAKEAE